MNKFSMSLCIFVSLFGVMGLMGAKPAAGLTLGVLPEARINDPGAVFTTGDYSILRGELGLRGDEVKEIPTLTTTSLADVDVFYTSLLDMWGSGELNADEQTALSDWVWNGGILFVSGEVEYFQETYNTWLNPFGISESGQTSYPFAVTAVIVAPMHPIINGPSGTVTDLKLRTAGYFAPGDYTTIATYNDMPVLIEKKYGAGSIVAVGDHDMFLDQYIGLNEKTLFLNVLDLSNKAACQADFDTDGDVDGTDLAVFASEFGRTDCTGDCKADFDHDGDVDGSDLAVFASDFGRTDCQN